MRSNSSSNNNNNNSGRNGRRRSSLLTKLIPKNWVSNRTLNVDNNSSTSPSSGRRKKDGHSSNKTNTSGSGTDNGANAADDSYNPVTNRFLVQTKPAHFLALLDRQEIQVGKLLGEGSFCQVMEVQAITLQDQYQEKLPPSSPDEQRRRERRRQEFAAGANGSDGITDDAQQQQQPQPQKKYAIKQISTKLANVPDGFQHAAADLVLEASYLMRLNHPHILKVHAVAMDSQEAFDNQIYDKLFLVADCMAGTLHELLDKWKKSSHKEQKHIMTTPVLARKCHYAIQIVEALEYLHVRRIIFRDLKPHNVGYLPIRQAQEGEDGNATPNPDGNVGTFQLFDFGFCREIPEGDEVLFRMSKVGSPAYMAPEAKDDDGMYNLKADMYSFAVVFYEMLMLQHPFRKARRRSSHEGVPKKLTKMPNGIQELLQGTWNPSVDQRWTSRETRARLEAILQELEDEQEAAEASR